MTKKILIIEGEKRLAYFISLGLQREGYSVAIETNGRLGLQTAFNDDFDLILLDTKFFDTEGLEIKHHIQSEKNVAVLMMVERDFVNDNVIQSEKQLDNYIVKPFAIEELIVRVRTMLQQQETIFNHQKANPKRKNAMELRLNPRNRSVLRGDDTISLTKREYDLLNILLSNTNHVVTREELLADAWSYNTNMATNVVDVYIRYLRRKIDLPGKESYIQTVRGRGYIIKDNR